MLEALCGSRSVQRILLFLFVNSRCYGAQLHRLLNTPLTPIQKALQRLEEGGIVLSHLEGKTRVYQFNPAYPLLGELEQLLRKAYTLLPGQERNCYYVAKEDPMIERKGRILLNFWQKLSSVQQLTFNARTHTREAGWNGKGRGQVTVTPQGEGALLFHEKGSWVGVQGQETAFSNIYRWSLDRATGLIALEHLRHGTDNPVFLVHLAPSGPQSLSSVDSHLCAADSYFGQIFFSRQQIRFHWRVIGPKKNEEIDYYYT
jgi:hypothetical protein